MPVDPSPEASGNRSVELRRLLDDQRLVEEIVALRSPIRPSWYQSSGLIALITLVLSSMLTFGIQHVTRRADEHLALHKARLELAQARISHLAELMSGLLLAAERRTKMAQGRFDDLDTTDMRIVRDSTNAADERWENGKQTSEFFIQFHFGDDTSVTQEWSRVRSSVQAYGDCADSVYRKFAAGGTAPSNACRARHDSAYAELDRFTGALLRGYRRLEEF
jgi:hypothetical protein